jgi:hypothetical protein
MSGDSPTGANRDTFEAYGAPLRKLEEAFPIQPGQCGAVLAIGDDLCLDAVSRPDQILAIRISANEYPEDRRSPIQARRRVRLEAASPRHLPARLPSRPPLRSGSANFATRQRTDVRGTDNKWSRVLG